MVIAVFILLRGGASSCGLNPVHYIKLNMGLVDILTDRAIQTSVVPVTMVLEAVNSCVGGVTVTALCRIWLQFCGGVTPTSAAATYSANGES